RAMLFISQSTHYRYEAGGAYNGALVSTSVTANSVDSATGTLYDATTTTTEASTANGAQAGAQYVQRILHSSLFTDTSNWCIGRPAITQRINSHNLSGGAQITRRVDTSWN